MAQSSPVKVALEYSAPAECPSARAFWGFLAERSQRLVQVAPVEASVVVRVVVQAREGRVNGRLEVVQNESPSEPRFVTASDCAGVVDALALTAVLSIDEEASLGTQDSHQPKPVESAVYSDPVDDLPDRPHPPLRWQSALRVLGITSFGVDLPASFGIGASVALLTKKRPGWSPSLQLGGSYLRSDLFGTSDMARFVLSTLQLTGCPIHIGTDELGLRPCVTAQVGVLDASGQNLTVVFDDRTAWVAVGPILQLEYRVYRGLYANLDVGGVVPLLPQQYFVGEPRERIAQTSALAPWLGLGVSQIF
jgi:hypothetical protein